MRFCTVRLGKDSVPAIKAIDSVELARTSLIKFSIICKQVPIEVLPNTYCLIWLGSDNNKGAPTSWEQGLRAFGKVIGKHGGPNYNDDWQLDIEVGLTLKRSIKKHDLLATSNAAYYWCSNIPIIGLNTSSNQTVQIIKPDEPRQDVAALFYCINSVDHDFYYFIDQKFPELRDYITFAPSNNEEEIVEEENIDLSNPVISSAFNPLLVNIDNRIINLDSIIKRLSRVPSEIDLYPEFQRKDNLWNVTEQSRLIESILIRFPIPAFYFDGSDPKRWLVVDGLQRLSSIKNFVLDKTLKLTNLEFLVQLNGAGYDDLGRDLQRIIEETEVAAYIINPGTPEDVKFNIFKRINTGGLILEPQEIRHALFQGKPAQFIAELAELPEFKRVVGRIKTQRMLDRDFVNRFFAFYVLGFENYTPDLDSFMSKAMGRIYNMSYEELLSVKQEFIKSMKANYLLLDNSAFRKVDLTSPRKRPLNKALFDIFSVLLARLKQSEIDIVVNRRSLFWEKYVALLKFDITFQSAISTSTSEKNRVFYRFRKLQQLLNEVIHHD